MAIFAPLMIYRLTCLFAGLLLSFYAFSQQQEVDSRELITRSLEHIREIKGLKYHLRVIERGRKGLNYYESSVKFNRKPRKIYLYIKGIEVLWVQGKNNGKALVKPNSFPYFNLLLDPMGDLMRQDQHHTLHEMGFDYFASIIQHTMDKLGDRFNEFVSYEGEHRINNRPCHKVIINNRDYAYVSYTVGKGESITSIARKLYIPEYLILENNKKLDDYFDILEPGTVMRIPNWYAKTVTMYIDQLYFVPISIKVEDDKGLFEEYNYHFLQVNPLFEEAEFTKDYKDYGF